MVKKFTCLFILGLGLFFVDFVFAEPEKIPHKSDEGVIKAHKLIGGDVVVSETVRIVTAYNAGDPNQNHGNPCISANGEDLCRALARGQRRCAANFVPLGTKLYIETYGICKVTDRTNRRYRNRVDIAMRLDERRKAIQFGKRKLKVKILKKILAQATPTTR